MDIYAEALLIDDELADEIWELWHYQQTTNELAENCWWLVASGWRHQPLSAFRNSGRSDH
jgi:hypothetical protein